MKEKVIMILVMATFTLTMAADACFAKKQKDMICVAGKVEGKNITLKCRTKDLKRVEIGSKYKIRKQIDGC